MAEVLDAPLCLPPGAPDNPRGLPFPQRRPRGGDGPHTELFDTMPREDDLVPLALDSLPAAVHETVFVRNPEALCWSQ